MNYRNNRQNRHGGRFRAQNHSGSRGFSGQRRPEPHYDPAMFVKKAEEQGRAEYQPTNNFADFDIDPRLKQNILAHGYSVPTPIQDQTIPILLAGRDVVGCANTGTGKTAAFLVPLIEKVLKNRSEKVLIVTPTRELAIQIQRELKEFSKNLDISSVLCIGGVGIGLQIKTLHTYPDFVIGTPGRLKDLEQRRKLNLNNYRSIVLDEVDRMLDMGFIHDIRLIVSKLPKVRHSLFFSATMPEKVIIIMQEFLNNPVSIAIKTQPFSANVDQDVLKLNGRNKVDVLNDLLLDRAFQKVLVFGRTKWGMEKLYIALQKKGVQVAAIHGNKTQGQRQKAIEMFKNNSIQVLVATDVASRGLDIDKVTHVINYDLPQTYDDYIHRIGRTGRANNKGSAITFIA
jgi:superfamily II DNA/RNA helicase